MECFSEDYSNQLLTKEWLVRIDSSSSAPYLFKFCVLPEDNSCCLMITDTKTVWTEVLSQKQVLRRWQACNDEFSTEFTEEQSSRVLSLLSLVHTYYGLASSTFDVVKSREADFAFDLDFDEFKWRWETYLVGPKTSANVISQHLVMPLLSLTHLAFASADPLSELPDTDLESAIDKLGRTARRAHDIHVKHTISKPRITTSLQRISALLDFAPTLPAIRTEPEETDLDELLVLLRGCKPDITEDFTKRPAEQISETQHPFKSTNYRTVSQATVSAPIVKQDSSATENSDVEMEAPVQPKPYVPPASLRFPSPIHEDVPPPVVAKSDLNRHDVEVKEQSPTRSSSSPKPTSKKIRTKMPVTQISSESDSDSVSRPKAKESSAAPRRQSPLGTHSGRTDTAASSLRTVRQPIKRGGKRF